MPRSQNIPAAQQQHLAGQLQPQLGQQRQQGNCQTISLMRQHRVLLQTSQPIRRSSRLHLQAVFPEELMLPQQRLWQLQEPGELSQGSAQSQSSGQQSCQQPCSSQCHSAEGPHEQMPAHAPRGRLLLLLVKLGAMWCQQLTACCRQHAACQRTHITLCCHQAAAGCSWSVVMLHLL